MEKGGGERAFIGFHLGLALLLIMLVSMSCLFSCCLFWEKRRSLFQSSRSEDSNDQTDIATTNEITLSLEKPKQGQAPNINLPILMPGEQIPKFIAMACPFKPSVPTEEMVIIKVHEPPLPPPPSVLMSTIKLLARH